MVNPATMGLVLYRRLRSGEFCCLTWLPGKSLHVVSQQCRYLFPSIIMFQSMPCPIRVWPLRDVTLGGGVVLAHALLVCVKPHWKWFPGALRNNALIHKEKTYRKQVYDKGRGNFPEIYGKKFTPVARLTSMKIRKCRKMAHDNGGRSSDVNCFTSL